MTLPKDDIIKLLGKAKNFNQVIKILFYLEKSFLLFLEVIIEAKDSVIKLFNDESIKIEEENKKIKDTDEKKEIPLIDIEKYVDPKEGDDIQLISEKAFFNN